MKYHETKISINTLIESFKAGSLLRNDEYQRGEAWSLIQKAAFVDSIFRSYPIPAIFLHTIQSPGLLGKATEKWEIVDGQQRLTALRDFRLGNFKLLEVNAASKLRLPKGVRAMEAPWAGKSYDDLSDALKKQLDDKEITVFMIGPETDSDEIRDLFIRLQSGTALSRQQIRDAWPGNLGPYIEQLAGKLRKQPGHRIFSVIDKRGAKMEDEEQKDYRVADRQVCAQILRIYLAREYDARAYPSVSANELDSMYHQYTDFDPNGSTAAHFRELLTHAADVFERVKAKLSSKGKFRRLDVTAVIMFLQDVTKNPQLKVDRKSIEELAAAVAGAATEASPAGKSTSGGTLERHYTWWRENIAPRFGIMLDEKRDFDDGQKDEIFKRDAGLCHVCDKQVEKGDDEYDHHPIPHRDGGRTEVSNGKLVHRICHARGRPPAD